MTPNSAPAERFDRLEKLLDSWVLHLRGTRKSQATIDAYELGVNLWLDWCDEEGIPATLDKPTVSAFTEACWPPGTDAGPWGNRKPATAALRQQILKQFSKWLAEEGETETDALAGLPPVKVDVPVAPELTDSELVRLINACRGRRFEDRRDEALVRLMIDTDIRAGEACALTLGDLDLRQGLVTVRRGEGGKGRVVAIGSRTCVCLDRYLRARRSHPLAHLPDLWLGGAGRTLSYGSLWRAMKRRGEAAGLDRLARAAAEERFEKLVDPEVKLRPAERAKRAKAARKAHYQRMALLSPRRGAGRPRRHKKDPAHLPRGRQTDGVVDPSTPLRSASERGRGVNLASSRTRFGS